MKFKVGDKIRGISDSYSVANRSMTLAEVVEVIERPDKKYGRMEIKIIEHTEKMKTGLFLQVHNLDTDFELVEEKQMSKIDELEMKVKELSEEIEQLKEEKENETGKLEHGDVYWFINHIGEIKLATWYGDPEDKTRYELGNVFIARWEASFKLEQLKVEAELSRFSRPFDVGENNYIFYFSHRSNSICMGCYTHVQNGNIYFATEEIARKAIETVGADRIKKYYFGVED